MNKKTADRHTLCVTCRGFDCDVDTHCKSAWRRYFVFTRSITNLLKSKNSSKSKPSAPPPPADSVPSLQPPTRPDMHSQVDSLSVTVSSLAEQLCARLVALAASLLTPPSTQLSSQPRLGPDVGGSQPGVAAGYSRMFQALGIPDGTSVVSPHGSLPLDQGDRAPSLEQSGSAPAPQPQAAPGAAPPPSASFLPPQPRLRYGDPPPQPSTSGWVPSGPLPPCSARDSRSSSESEASEAESDASDRDSAFSRLADLIYEVCPDSLPLSDAARLPLCGFEAWFSQPESSAARQRFRLYPRVAEVELEVAAREEALARRSKPLSHVIPARSRRYALQMARCLLLRCRSIHLLRS